MLKWGGTAVCAAVLALWFVSIAAPVVWGNRSATIGSLCSGRIFVRHVEVVGMPRGTVSMGWMGPPARGLWGEWASYGLVLPYWNRSDLRVTAGVPGRAAELVVPCWLLLVTAAAPTAWLWWRDRRRIPPGHCQTCGYNLTGNVSGVCPECGTPTTQSTV